ncbi:MAG TPA: hypothetical protein DCQ06_05680 [Myxococcales bacterium]|nr:hypothetical protein [Myxococcales bacterium]HAN31070.1 hypothetical protein [Myxococcales bacterium]
MRAFLIPTLVLALGTIAQPAHATSSEVHVSAHAELGTLSVLSHRIKFGRSGTYIDYIKDAGQDNQVPFARLSLDIRSGRHIISFLYQPLEINASRTVMRDITVDDYTFKAGTGVRSRYSFPFTRASWMYDLIEGPNELALGLSLQIRNAILEFESTDGVGFRSNRDVGPVPILKVRGRHVINDRFWWGAEADGFYAPVSYINGDDSDVVGAILDLSFRAGMKLRGNTEAFLNLRYLGGGATGESNDDTDPGDGYTRNWLHFVTISLGFTWNAL